MPLDGFGLYAVQLVELGNTGHNGTGFRDKRLKPGIVHECPIMWDTWKLHTLEQGWVRPHIIRICRSAFIPQALMQDPKIIELKLSLYIL
jgi:hypothetical protein